MAFVKVVTYYAITKLPSITLPDETSSAPAAAPHPHFETTGHRRPMNPRPRAMSTALAFGATSAMWAVCYLSLMQPGLVVGEVLVAILLLCPFAAGWIAGRAHASAGHGAVAGFKVGLGIALLNLLIVGSLLMDESRHVRPHAWAWIAGTFSACAGLAALGGAIGGRIHPAPRLASANWLNAFTWIAAATIFLLLMTGGLVTGLEAGLAVPDWPNSYGHNMLLFPLSEMTGGIYFEHAHRLYGMLVGVTSIALLITMIRMEDRVRVRMLAVAVLLLVITQGILGGTRVVEKSVGFAIAHGILGQLVFVTAVSLTAFTATTWRTELSGAAVLPSSLDRTGATHLFRLLLVQLVLGALYRHLNAQPGVSTPVLHSILGLHVLVAIGALVGAIAIGGRAWAAYGPAGARPAAIRIRSRCGLALLTLVCAQVALGVVSLVLILGRSTTGQSIGTEVAATSPAAAPAIPLAEVIFTSAHQATGALVLAASALLMLWTRRITSIAG